ncbi:MAG TPA: YceI family protein [Puia sp.]|nr:YceI family protein [Puia sp.]
MKKLGASICMQFLCAIVFGQDYMPVDQGSSVSFKVKNFGFYTGGTFSGLQGHIRFDRSNLASSTFDVTIDATSVNTGVSMRDDHLKEDLYFNVKRYPRIRFVSTSIKPGRENAFEVKGKLTIKDRTHDLNFPFTVTQSNDGYVFNGEFRISRKDYDIGGSSSISDAVDITLTVAAKKSLSNTASP